MSELRELYQEIILDHNRSPRNFGEMTDATHWSSGHNPLCGDKFEVYLKITDSKIEDIRFVGSGCAISKASASLMTHELKGATIEHAQQLFLAVRDMLTGKLKDENEVEKLGKLAVLSGVCQFPMRVKCATLAWHTLDSAMKKKCAKISTE